MAAMVTGKGIGDAETIAVGTFMVDFGTGMKFKSS